MLAELLATEGVVEECELRSEFGFMAFHGGSLEAMTDVIAKGAAARAGASLYVVRQPWDLRWHVPSVRFDPAESEALRRFVEHVHTAVAVHGWGTDGWSRDTDPSASRPVLCGGTNRALAKRIADVLGPRIDPVDVVAELDAMPRGVRGVHPRNPVNLPRGGGVQLELPPYVRGLPPFWTGDSVGLACPVTDATVEALAGVACG